VAILSCLFFASPSHSPLSPAIVPGGAGRSIRAPGRDYSYFSAIGLLCKKGKTEKKEKEGRGRQATSGDFPDFSRAAKERKKKKGKR